ncbi:MAG: sigma-54 dependent transcriptional regulator [Bacteroidetes bacterium]|nr:sigma-54 dependent transcriptional regulator [Bacteroidota bacterium]MBU1720836.1 sigma-54 dependent transcriptional regulator [Bacteroidota bacterium]
MKTDGLSGIKVLVIEDDPTFSTMLSHKLRSFGFSDIHISSNGRIAMNGGDDFPDIITLDYNLGGPDGVNILKTIRENHPETPVILLSGQKEVNVVVEAFKNGASGYIIKNSSALVELENSLKIMAERILLRREVEKLREQVRVRTEAPEILGESEAIKRTFHLITKAATTNIQVMITGNSGTGKELVAKAIHENSDRKRRPYIVVNLAAIPPDLVESELFGYEKGAFTDARHRRIGKFEEANRGTIFLDEIGEMDMSLQTKLLRVLQEKKVTRLGSSKEISFDSRIICATNRNLRQLVDNGKFREDLYYRIHGFLIHLPDLIERENDIILLSNHFINGFCAANAFKPKKLTLGAITRLVRHAWPGNIRELKSLIERAIMVSEENEITENDLIFI